MPNRGDGWEELPHIQGQGQRPRGAALRPRSGAVAGRSYPISEVRGGSWEELPTSEVRGGSQKELPHAQGAMAVQAQEGLEELLHVQGQEGWL